jgi:hypothetical protein
MVDNPHNLKRLFGALQEELLAGLKANKVIDHPGAKGAATEADWLRILQQHLPERYRADRALIIDVEGNVSDYIDIVIYDRVYCPVIFARNREQYIPAESVYAVFEVKQSLNLEHVRYAGDKIASVRRLKRTNAAVHTLDGPKPGRPLSPILGGLLATTSDWNPPFGEPFEGALGELNADRELNIGCIVDSGSFKVDGESKKVAVSDPTTSLVRFFVWTLEELQKKANVPAIEWPEYGKVLDT